MGFLNKLSDKIADTASAASEKAKEVSANAMAAHNEKKAQAQALDQEMKDLAERQSAEIIAAINAYDNGGKSFFDGTGREELLRFTKDFFERLMLPASSVGKSKINMYPHIDAKALAKQKKSMPILPDGEELIFTMTAEGKQEIVLTDQALYFKLAVGAGSKHFAMGRIDIGQVSVLSTRMEEESCKFLCDEYVLASFAKDKVIQEDFLSLGEYFRCIAEHDFEITDEEVDALIREKIGQSVLTDVKKHMIFDDERFIYFAWGLNSLTAKDYIVCTDKQIILVDRELGGMTENVRQFYYEDITSVNVLQNSNSGDFTVDLISSAITSATKTCDMEITVAGSSIKIDTLFKIEAERIVAVFHEMKKQAKLGAAQQNAMAVQAAVQAQSALLAQSVMNAQAAQGAAVASGAAGASAASAEESPLEKLQKLAKLHEAGILSDEEFAAKKTELLGMI